MEKTSKTILIEDDSKQKEKQEKEEDKTATFPFSMFKRSLFLGNSR